MAIIRDTEIATGTGMDMGTDTDTVKAARKKKRPVNPKVLFPGGKRARNGFVKQKSRRKGRQATEGDGVCAEDKNF